jgi:NarL family two-component system response regulator YdfI
MKQVHVAATQPVVRAGLETVVRAAPGLKLASSGNTDDLEQHIDDISADVLLIALPNLTEDWIATLTSVAIPSVVLSDIASPFPALRAGLRAILSPEASPSEISAALFAAAAGLVTIPPSALDLPGLEIGRVSNPLPNPLDAPLTARELEVLTLLAEGHSNKMIAQSLGISDHTIKFHVTAIMNKLQAGSRTDAVMQAIRRGLIMI